MNELQIFNNPELGEVRVIGNFENPRFCLSDVCKILEIGNPSQAKARLDKGVITNETLQTAGGMQTLTFVNEDGLYDLILDSRKPAAKKLRKWLTSEVVPSIRKTGMYIDASRPISGDQLILIGKRMKELENQVAELKPDAEYCREVLKSNADMLPTTVAKALGTSVTKFHRWLVQSDFAFFKGTEHRVCHLKTDYSGKGYERYLPVLCKDGKYREQMFWTQQGFKWIRELWRSQQSAQIALF